LPFLSELSKAPPGISDKTGFLAKGAMAKAAYQSDHREAKKGHRKGNPKNHSLSTLLCYSSLNPKKFFPSPLFRGKKFF